ncbi:response regulator transcription factor [Paenibacillus nasutitermitis]|uniref:DNA-binding response regulator n=1 Tax=Paenibacillus nasutitermitis TaxID=1652958 RepID=A0A916YUT8_9BACL|nr:response regulator [Paenibacillus nasutitermitis]GGD62147.1 DNA-binding response regulator [Paenibacillus nasutitermitis]
MKILVVDDENLVRDSVIQSLESLGFSDIEEAVDGIEALHQIERHRPDLIIADIRMPRMDGIELLAKLKQMNDETFFVLLSGYDLFEYVQTALDLGALSYLLKPVSARQLEVVIHKLKKKLNQQSRFHESNLLMKIKMNQGISSMRRHFIEELVTQKSNSENYLRHQFHELEISFVHRSFCVLSISLDRYIVLVERFSPNEISLIKYGIENIAGEIFMNRGFFSFAFDLEDGLGLLVNFPDEDPNADMSPIMKPCIEIKDSILKFLQHEVTIGIGTTTTDFFNLIHSYETSKRALSQRLIRGGNCVIPFENPDVRREKFKVLSFQIEQEMLSAFEKCEQEAAMNIVKELYTPFFSLDFVDRASLLKLNFQIILLIHKILERLDVAPMALLGDELTLYEEVNQRTYIDEIIGWFHETLKISFEALQQAREKGNKRIVEKARRYIHENYAKELSLESVAEHIHLTPTYFSSIFKKEMNGNFVDYVSNYRIEKAKELLRAGIHNVNVTAAMVGFNNVKYFYKVFKKRTGYTPSEYKDI